MTELHDKEIIRLCRLRDMITPFEASQVRYAHAKSGRPFGEKLISYGVSSFGYDVRLGSAFRLFDGHVPGLPEHSRPVVDPKHDDPRLWTMIEETKPYFDIPAYGFVLAETLEKFNMPPDVKGRVEGKSTYARVGQIMLMTPLEPAWRGKLTLELYNPLPNPVRLYIGEGICQIGFIRGEQPEVTYADRDGKYQDQPGIVPASV